MRFRVVALFVCLLLLPASAWAATVDFSSGTVDYVIGNAVNAGDLVGIGGTDSSSLISNNANASGNTVTVTGGMISTIISGGYHATSDHENTAANANRVNITNFSGSIYTQAYGGYAGANTSGFTATASGNSASISGGIFSTIFGGQAVSPDSAALADGNTARAIGLTVGNIHGGLASLITDAATAAATATGNEATVTNSAVSGDIRGGRAYGASGSATAANNSITLSGGTVSGNVYGGLSELFDSGGGSGSATGNSLTVSGAPDLASSELYGGLVRNQGDLAVRSGDAFSGNALNLKTSGLTVKGLYNFQNINFYLPSTLAAGETVLTVIDEARLSENADGSGRQATVNVGIAGGSSPLGVGDQVTLLNAGTLTGTPVNTAANGRGMQGLSLFYDFALSRDANNLYATVTSLGSNPQLKALLEGQAASAAFVGQGAELAAGQGMYGALAAARSAPAANMGGAFTFGALSGGASRYNTGSHVNVDGFSLMAGLGWNFVLNEGKNGNLLFAPFFEAGRGGYDSHNSFREYASVKGDGDISYYGGGLLARYDTPPMGPGNLYVDGSFRLGRVETDFSSSDIRNPMTGEKADYETDAVYYGAHLGLGYLRNISGPMNLDIYTKYLWTRQEGDSVSMAGERYTFDDVDSHRWRTGARFSCDAGLDSGAVFTPYIGAAFDYEFDSKARGNVNGRGIDSPDIRGATGMGEIGLAFKPSAEGGLSLDLGLQGYAGKREGVSGSLQVKWEF